MTNDPIVDEVRAIRDAIAREHDYDIAAISRAIREEAAAAGVRTVTLASRPVAQRPENAVQQAVAADE